MTRHSVGSFLKNERETRDLSIEEVSSTTRIPRRTLESLEQDRFEDLPSGVFVRGFVKAYASAVDIDAHEALAHLDRELPEDRLPPPRLGIEGRRRYGLLVAITTAVLFAIIVASFVMVRRAPAHDEPIELSSADKCQVRASRVEHCSYGRSTIGIPTESSPS